MFEEQSQKLYVNVIESINNLFSKKPFLCSLIISLLVSVIVFLVSLDLGRGEAKVEISQTADISVKNTTNTIVVDLSGAVKKPDTVRLFYMLVSVGAAFSHSGFHGSDLEFRPAQRKPDDWDQRHPIGS